MPELKKSGTSSLRTPLPFAVTLTLVAGLTAAIVIAVALLAQNILWDYAVREASHDHLDAMDRNAWLIESRLRGRANDMFFLKKVAEDELARNPKAPLISENFRSAVTTMMLARSQYDKIFLLSVEGREIFRYNWKGGEHPLEEVPASEYQDKSDRPFYRETVQAAPGDAVFSPLELTLEHDKIVYPIKPVVRISGQIVGPDGKPRALLALNYQAERIVQELRQDKSQPQESMLLNTDGFWIVGPDRDAEFAFMYPARKGESLKEKDPDLWKKISTGKGWFEENGSLYCFENIDPVASAPEYSPLRMPVRGGERLRWTLLTKVPDAVIWQNVHKIRMGIWMTCAAVTIVLVPLVCVGLTGRRRRRIAAGEVREARELLDSVISSSLHGIVVMEAMRDERGRIVDLRLVMANQAAAHLVGRDLAQGKGTTMLQGDLASKTDGSFDRYCQVIETGEPVTFEHLHRHADTEVGLAIRAA